MLFGNLEERFKTIEEKVAAILYHVSLIGQVDLTIRDLEERIRELGDRVKNLSSRINAHLVATIDYEMNDHCCGIEHVEFKQDYKESDDDDE